MIYFDRGTTKHGKTRSGEMWQTKENFQKKIITWVNYDIFVTFTQINMEYVSLLATRPLRYF